MAGDEERADENTQLLKSHGRLGSIQIDAEAISSHLSKEEQALGETSVGERLPYNDYCTIDWLHDLVSTIQLVLTDFADPRTRSRIPSASDQSTVAKVCATIFSPHGTHARGGSLRP